jgi:molybdopterin-guanine dinucleotide biosynthesis protein
MKKHLHLFFIVPLIIGFGTFRSKVINAQELKLVSFKHLKGNTTARVNRRRDVNGQNCAVVIIKHNFNDFTVEAGKDYEHLEEKTGETWVWLSPDEYQLVIRKKTGYIPLQIPLKDELKELETYELVVTDEFGTIEVEAPNAQIWLDDKAVAKNEYTFRLKEGRYTIKATRDKYKTQEEWISLNAGDYIKHNFNLQPKMGTLDISSSPNATKGADIFIDNKLIDEKTPASIPLLIGNYSVKLASDGFLPFNQNIRITENKTTNITAQMQVDPTLEIQRHKRLKTFWLISTVITSGTGGYSLWQSQKLYDEYYNAGSNATDIHQKVEMYDILAPVAFGISGFCLVEFIIHASKQGKAKRKLNLYSSYYEDGGMMTLTYNF